MKLGSLELYSCWKGQHFQRRKMRHPLIAMIILGVHALMIKIQCSILGTEGPMNCGDVDIGDLLQILHVNWKLRSGRLFSLKFICRSGKMELKRPARHTANDEDRNKS